MEDIFSKYIANNAKIANSNKSKVIQDTIKKTLKRLLFLYLREWWHIENVLDVASASNLRIKHIFIDNPAQFGKHEWSDMAKTILSSKPFSVVDDLLVRPIILADILVRDIKRLLESDVVKLRKKSSKGKLTSARDRLKDLKDRDMLLENSKVHNVKGISKIMSVRNDSFYWDWRDFLSHL